MLSTCYLLKIFGHMHKQLKVKRKNCWFNILFFVKDVGKLFIKILILKYFFLSLFFVPKLIIKLTGRVCKYIFFSVHFYKTE